MLKAKVKQEYVQIDAAPWMPFPPALSEGGIKWKLLHVSPEMGAWTAIFACPKGSSFARHVHIGPGEYLLTRGRMEVRGGEHEGGATAVAPGYGYESTGARHDRTFFPVTSEFYMTFLGPLNFISEDGQPLAVVGWEEAQSLWDQQTRPARKTAASTRKPAAKPTAKAAAAKSRR